MGGADDGRRVFLTGATGFVGGSVLPALVAAGWRVRCLTRNAAAARRRQPDQEWIEGDVTSGHSLEHSLDGCQGALFLVHGMGQAADFERTERDGARLFSLAAARAGVQRLVYLGGVAPASGEPSPHLRSRLQVGTVLREGATPTIELRASMIVGHGSLSWQIVRDLAARLPLMVLPAWLNTRTQPVAIEDVVTALVRALDLPPSGSQSFDLPGPEVLSGRQILDQAAEAMGLRVPWKLELPVLTPRLSSLWVRFVTGARWPVAREVVQGLTNDLLARDDRYWSLIAHARRLRFAEAARRALATEGTAGPARGVWAALERARSLRPA
jgi:uncharacterized protein YbjT (DUF2867 family)